MKTTATVQTRSTVKEDTGVELSRVGVSAIGITSAVIGCWAVVSLGAGMVSSGGPAGLVANFVSAFIG